MLPGLRRALLHVQGREAGAGAAGGARALPGRGEADPAAHPRVEGFDAADVQAGLFHLETMASPSRPQACMVSHQDLLEMWEADVAVWDCWFANQKRLYDAQSQAR